MKYAIVLLFFLFLSCQSVIRFTSARNIATQSMPPPSYSSSSSTATTTDSLYIVGSGGTVDPSRMGKIIAGYLRAPYLKGGADKNGIDCSGLVSVVYQAYNKTQLPANASRLYNDLKKIKDEDIRYGDLVFFSTNGSDASHVGIYVGYDKFVHAAESQGVIISSMKDSYYHNAFRGARRVLW